MSPTRPSKRRRIDNASHTLSQPFKSPFKNTPLKLQAENQSNIPTTHPSLTKPSAITTKSPPSSPPKAKTSLPTAPTPTRTPLRSSSPTTTTTSSPTYTRLQAQHTRLLNRLSAARASLETSTQALKIESSDRKIELEVLIQKWRGASRAAAEEVFAKARDRVNKMGGVGAMREREKEGRERVGGWGWDEGGKGEREGGEGDGVEGEDGERDERDGRDEVDEREEGGMSDKQDKDVVEDGEGYTMDMMLKTLNVELDIIGFDKGLQKWVD